MEKCLLCEREPPHRGAIEYAFERPAGWTRVTICVLCAMRVRAAMNEFESGIHTAHHEGMFTLGHPGGKNT